MLENTEAEAALKPACSLSTVCINIFLEQQYNCLGRGRPQPCPLSIEKVQRFQTAIKKLQTFEMKMIKSCAKLTPCL